VPGTFVTPIRTGSRYRLQAAGVGLEIDADVGGRVVELSLEGRNVLLPSTTHAANYGSTLWTSPQSEWGWPPPPEIDREPYRARVEGDWVVLEGYPSPAIGIAVTKSFRMGVDGTATIRYVLVNHKTVPVHVAPWEVTRVEHRGVSFFPLGDRTYDVPGFTPVPFSRERGLAWVDHGVPSPGDRKLFADARKGWLAHAADGVVFVKRFEHAPGGMRAPGEAEIEIYVNADPPYVELEQQGPFSQILPGGALLWSVEWRLFQLDAPTRTFPGDDALVALAESFD
jgi:hypothetical protein